MSLLKGAPLRIVIFGMWLELVPFRQLNPTQAYFR